MNQRASHTVVSDGTSRVDREDRPRGTTFNAKLDLVEAMGAEFYAHFGIKGKMVQSEELLTYAP